MKYFAAVDVWLKQSSVCVVYATRWIIREAKVMSEPKVLVRFFSDLGLSLTRIGPKAGPLSQWLHAGLVEAGVPSVLIKTCHVKAALSAMTVKTNRNDARGMAQLLRLGWFRPVHAKTPRAQETSAKRVRVDAGGIGVGGCCGLRQFLGIETCKVAAPSRGGRTPGPMP